MLKRKTLLLIFSILMMILISLLIKGAILSDTILINNGTSTTLTQAPQTNLSVQVYNQTWLNFDGVNGYINMSNKPAHDIYQSPFTISFWIYPINITNNVLPRVMEKRTSFVAIMGNQSNARFSQITLEMQNATGTNTIEFWSLTNVTMNDWQMWTLVWNGTNATWYKNGVSDSVRQINVGGAFTNSINTSTQEMFIAKRRADNTRNLNGSLDEIRLYNINLNSTQIAEIYNSGRTRNTSLLSANLVLWLSMNENQGTTVYDTSGLANNGTIVEAVYQTDGINLTLIQSVDFLLSNNLFTLINDIYSWTQIRLSYDSTPRLNITHPLNNSHLSFPGLINVTLNVTAEDLDGISVMWYNINNGQNVTFTNTTGIYFGIPNGQTKSYTIYVFTNDSFNNLNSALVYITISQTASIGAGSAPRVTANQSTIPPEILNAEYILEKSQTCGITSIKGFRQCVIDLLMNIWPGNKLENFLIFILIITSVIIFINKDMYKKMLKK